MAAPRAIKVEAMKITILYARETHGRIIAEIPDLPAVMASGRTKAEAKAKVMELGREVFETERELIRVLTGLFALRPG